jgi:substrate import-associated zinc metallohydrolase lipoprotein
MTLFGLNALSLDHTTTPASLLYGSLMNTDEPGTKENLAERLLDDYFHVIHHEFAHIMQQTKEWGDLEFGKIQTTAPITPGSYVGDLWTDSANSDQAALDNGFITRYGRSAPIEDFVEIMSIYITYTPERWAALVGKGSADGQTKINQKLTFVKNYLANSWKIDMDLLRATILNHANQLDQLEYDNLQ